VTVAGAVGALFVGGGAAGVAQWIVVLLIRLWTDRGYPSPWPALAGASAVMLGGRLVIDARLANLALTMGLWALFLVTTVEATRPRYDRARSYDDDGPIDLEQWDR
jgi:hypothetical protein